MIKGTDRNIPLPELHPFKDHPYKVEDNMEMDAREYRQKRIAFTHHRPTS